MFNNMLLMSVSFQILIVMKSNIKLINATILFSQSLLEKGEEKMILLILINQFRHYTKNTIMLSSKQNYRVAHLLNPLIKKNHDKYLKCVSLKNSIIEQFTYSVSLQKMPFRIFKRIGWVIFSKISYPRHFKMKISLLS